MRCIVPPASRNRSAPSRSRSSKTSLDIPTWSCGANQFTHTGRTSKPRFAHWTKSAFPPLVEPQIHLNRQKGENIIRRRCKSAGGENRSSANSARAIRKINSNAHCCQPVRNTLDENPGAFLTTDQYIIRPLYGYPIAPAQIAGLRSRPKSLPESSLSAEFGSAASSSKVANKLPG